MDREDAEVIWLHNDKPVEANAKFEIAKSGCQHSLIVHDLQPQDSGLYTAKVGGHDTSASLTICGMLLAHRRLLATACKLLLIACKHGESMFYILHCCFAILKCNLHAHCS